MSKETQVVFLRGKKVVLRPIFKTDLQHIVRWINDPEVREFLNAFLPQNDQDEEEWLARLGKNKSSDVVLLIETCEGKPIGLMGLHRINWLDRTATTGALIGEKEYWGKGFGTEAKLLLLDYAFNTLNLRRICSDVLAFNGRSYAYLKKCGYKEEGIKRQHIFRNGEYYDLIQLAVFRDEFKPIWQQYQEGI